MRDSTGRNLIRLVAGMLPLLVAGPPALAQVIQCYTDQTSYLPGDTITVFVSTTAPSFSLEISRDAWTPQVMMTMEGLTADYQFQPWTLANELWKGAGWPPAFTVTIPDHWPTGSYLIRLVTDGGAQGYRPFVVRHPIPGSQSRVAFLANYNTVNAYNSWGGASLYFSTVGHPNGRASHVGFLRPWSQAAGRGKFYTAQRTVHNQLQDDGFDPEYITEWDIENIPGLLRPYDVVVLAGHHEYISRPIYDALCEHHDRGGHLAFFSANDIWWQVRYENDGQIMVGYRGNALTDDPMVGVNDDLVTTLWGSALLNRPGEALQGISYNFNTNNSYARVDFIVQDGSHWIFAGTGLQTGDPLGHMLAASETDYIQAASPPIMDVVLYASRPLILSDPEFPPFSEAAAIYYEDSPAYGFANGRGGQVFSAGSEGGWSFGLLESQPGYDKVRIATRNVIQHMVDAPHDCNSNGIEDAIDISSCGAGDITCADCDANGVPDSCDLIDCPFGVDSCSDCNSNGVLDRCDITACTAGDASCADCNGNMIPDGCERDCNANQIADSCDISDCTTFDTSCDDCNTNGVPDGCEVDCNANGIPNDCDMSACTPGEVWCQDCDTNGVMDECDVLTCGGDQSCADCDGNSQPDPCQPDFDADTVIDACDADQDDDGVIDTSDVCLTSPLGSTVIANGGPSANVNSDCHVDLADIAWLQRCFSGSGVPTTAPCDAARLDGDNDVDDDDAAIMIANLTGPAN